MPIPNSIITEPGDVFRVFSNEYRKLRPRMPITASHHYAIDAVIDGIAHGDDLTTIRLVGTTRRPEPFGEASTHKCSAYFLHFLDRLGNEMQNQKTYRISPTRACELLYHLDDGEVFKQPSMRMVKRGREGLMRSWPGYFDERQLEKPASCNWTIYD